MSVEASGSNEQLRADTDRLGGVPRAADEGPLSSDDVYHLLQNQRRRGVLRCLRDVDTTVQMGNLAEQVAAREHDTTVRELTSEQRQRVYIALYQSHLPKLDEAGVVEYEQRRGNVTPTQRVARLARYLDVEGDDATTTDGGDGSQSNDVTVEALSRWTSYYVSATGVSAVLLALAAFDVGVFGSFSALGVGLTIVVMFGLLSLGVVRRQRRSSVDIE
jgi:hypothetical protein